MRDFVICIDGDFDEFYVHAFGGPSYWTVEFEPYTAVSPVELLYIAEVLQQMFDDLEVQFAEV